ncbi:transposase, partial [Aeromonas caviae]|uniref:transposase n=1 Tax=Aeromonas caviae TaxID=648 RepID=UPI0019255D82
MIEILAGINQQDTPLLLSLRTPEITITRSNWKKQKAKIQRLHSHIANSRRDYLHKVTTTISKNHAMIVI